ncbi:MAG: hypothetical protein R3E58_16400 [Phycisphaerae bacterium]
MENATIDLVFDPPWSPERMSEAALLTLNIDDPSQYRPPTGQRSSASIRTSGAKG